MAEALALSTLSLHRDIQPADLVPDQSVDPVNAAILGLNKGTIKSSAWLWFLILHNHFTSQDTFISAWLARMRNAVHLTSAMPPSTTKKLVKSKISKVPFFFR